MCVKTHRGLKPLARWTLDLEDRDVALGDSERTPLSSRDTTRLDGRGIQPQPNRDRPRTRGVLDHDRHARGQDLPYRDDTSRLFAGARPGTHEEEELLLATFESTKPLDAMLDHSEPKHGRGVLHAQTLVGLGDPFEGRITPQKAGPRESVAPPGLEKTRILYTRTRHGHRLIAVGVGPGGRQILRRDPEGGHPVPVGAAPDEHRGLGTPEAEEEQKKQR